MDFHGFSSFSHGFSLILVELLARGLEQELQQQVTRLRSSEEQGARLSAELSAAGTQMEAGLEQQRELAARSGASKGSGSPLERPKNR